MNILDKTGLTYLWSKIKGKIDAKQNKITYGSAEPTGGANGDVYLMTVNEDTADKVGDLSTLTTEDKSSVVGAINEVNNRIVYEMVLESATGTIEVTNLDMVADGGEYEFEFYHKEDTTGDLNITFNNIYSDYYTAGTFLSGSLTADGTPTMAYFYRQAKTRIYYGTGGGSDGNINFPATMTGRFYFSNNTRKTVGFELKNHFVVNGTQAIVDQCGVNGKQVENLTSINFTKENNGKFVAGTRLIIRRVN